MRQRYLTLIPVILVSLLCGCGGGGASSSNVSSSRTGRATISILWPTSSRLVPTASNSVRVEIKSGALSVGSKLVARPTGGGAATATFDSLPVGDLAASAIAYPQADGSGVAQAQGAVPLQIQANQNTAFTITMGSTIDHLEVSPAGPSVLVGQNTQVTVTAKDAAGNVVLTAPSKIQWTSGAVNYATVDNAGTVTGILPTGATPGPVQLTVTETESGKTANLSIAITSNTTVSVNPPQPTVAIGDPQTFTATVANTTNTGVTWSIQEGGAGGTISQAGTYVAPNTPGTYHVVVTSQYDNSKTATATVTVEAGNANVTIQ